MQLRQLAFTLVEELDWTSALIVEDVRKDYVRGVFRFWAVLMIVFMRWFLRRERAKSM